MNATTKFLAALRGSTRSVVCSSTLARLACAAVLAPAGSWAQSAWIGGTSTDWSNPSNWSAGVPDGVNAIVNTSSGNLATVSTSVSAQPNLLRLGDGASGTMNVQAGGSITVNGETWIGNTSSGVGTNNLSGGTYLGNSWFAVGRGGGKGTFNLTDGTLAVSGNPIGVGLDQNTMGVFNQSGGTVTSDADLWVGNNDQGGSQNSATYNLSGGSIAVNSWTVIGRHNTIGVLNISGGSLTKTSDNGNQMLIGVDTASSTGIINQTGGAITNTTSDTQLAGYNHGTGIWNLDGGLAVLSLLMICHDNNGDSIGTMNLNTNGALIVSQISGNGSVAASTFNFNGGTLMPGGANANFMSGLTRANVRNGGVIIDDGGFAVAISQNLTHSAIGGDNATDGGLIKNGNGTLALSGVNTYTGDTMVNAGTLEFDVTGSSASALRLANGTLLNLNFSGLFAVAHFYTNGVSLPNGTYNAGNLPGFITGSGNLQVSSTSLGIWDGGGMDNNWSTAANWDNGAEPIFPIGLTFAGSTRLVNNNDLSSITAASITFDAAAEAFVLNGNGITLAGNLGFNGNPAVPVTQTVNLSMGWTGSETIDTPTNGGLTLGGDITSSVDTSLIKLDAGTLTLGGTNTIASWDLDGGTTTITGNTTISGDGNSRIYVGDGDAFPNCSGTLIIQDGATLAINGDFADSFVIGRDSGSGTLIQNGGTLTFNPGNAPQNFFIGATSKAGTRSEFDMNGGLLDLNGNNFDVALGDRGVLSTGVVNQVSGAIANAGSLQLGALTATGCGVYNLSGGSLYLGAGGITTVSGNYALNLGGGTVGATASWASALNVNLTNLNGSVTFDTAGNTITLSGVLTGTGGLTVTGAGTLELSGPNTYTGDTTVNASTTLQLDVTGGSQGAVYLAKGAVLNLNFTGAHAVAACFTNGVALANGSYNANNLTGFITGGGVLTVGITPLTPTSISYSVSGGSLTINWPANYLGWVLQIQTNGLDAGLGTNWVDVAGSADVTSTNLPVNPAIPATFYRLRYP